MNLVIYESSSFGGCYDYVRFIFESYSKDPRVNSCKLIIPKNAGYNGCNVNKILIADKVRSNNRFYKKVSFLFRNIVNPFILLFFLFNKKKSVVLFNDFEQLTALLWVPFFSFFTNKHRFAIILHDPDRDAYPPSLKLSETSMMKIMSLMDVAFYHEFLPDKSYYRLNNRTKYFNVPHGIYPPFKPDSNLLALITEKKTSSTIFVSIIGNIRKEKNYHLAIEALKNFPNIKLIIAGKASNTSVETNIYKLRAIELGVSEQIIWIEKFMSDEELSAVISITDIVLLNYSYSFTSQSGILNVIAPFKKKLIVSETESSLAMVAKQFNIATMVKPDNLESLIEGIQKILLQTDASTNDWDQYFSYASWDNHVNIAINQFLKLK